MREDTEVLSGESYWSVHEELELDPQIVFDPVPAHRQTPKEPKPAKSW